MKRLSELFPSGIPKEPKAQNSAWYSIYKKHSEKVIVFHAHRSFLLTRDLAMLTLIFLPGSLAAHLIWGSTAYGIWAHMGLLLLILIGAIMAAQNYGRRFVGNVLVEELHNKKD